MFLKIRPAGFMSLLGVAVITHYPITTVAAATAGSGIAARHPGDKNIAGDSAVIFADDFESYTSPSQLTNKWDAAYPLPNIRIATEARNVFSGNKSLEMSLPISTREISNTLVKRLAPGKDTVFLRAYTKFDPNYSVTGSNHDGLRLSAKYPGAGIKAPANGTGFFLFLLQNDIGPKPRPGESNPGFSQIYAYWPKQRSNYGDHWFPDGFVLPPASGIGNEADWVAFPNQYPDFTPLPNFLPQRNRWYCYELMVKANTPGQHNGEVKYWIDGKVAGDFPDLNIRSISTLKMDEAHINLQSQHSEHVSKKWYDNVVIASQYIGPMAKSAASLSATSSATAQLENISTHLQVQTGSNVGIAGFVIDGPEAKEVLIRGLGPTLGEFGVTGAMQHPMLELHDGSGALIAANDNWKSTQEEAIAETELAPAGNDEAAILTTLQPGAYTVVEADANGGTGTGLLEVYDMNPHADSSLVNVSTRGLVQTGAKALISGCSVTADANDVVIRALGPSLTSLGVKDALADPVVTLYDSNANVIATNDNWKDSQQDMIAHTGLEPPHDLDAAIFARLPAGNYTAVVTGKNESTGVALVEVYAAP